MLRFMFTVIITVTGGNSNYYSDYFKDPTPSFYYYSTLAVWFHIFPEVKSAMTDFLSPQ